MDLNAVIVSYNSRQFLTDNIASLLDQEIPFKKIVVVDNHSQDDSLSILHRFPRVTILAMDENIGYAAAANRGIAACEDGAVLVANADTVFPPDFVLRTRECLQHDSSIGILSPLLLRFDRETVDSAGQSCSLALYPKEIGFNRNFRDVAVQERDVFSVCGAATIFSRQALERLRMGDEYYDEDFFMFWEDFDIGWRAQLLGIKVHFCPDVKAYHFRSGTLHRGWWSRFSLALSRPPPIRFHLVKNRYLCLIKNFRWRFHWWALPFVAAKDLLWIGSLTISSPKNIMALMHTRSIFRKALQKRRWIKSHE